MFQSVAPCPGKVAFQVEPFPAPHLEVVAEKPEITVLPIQDPVAITEPMKEPIVELIEESAEESVEEIAPVVESELVSDAERQEPEVAPFAAVGIEDSLITDEVDVEEIEAETEVEPTLESPFLMASEVVVAEPATEPTPEPEGEAVAILQEEDESAVEEVVAEKTYANFSDDFFKRDEEEEGVASVVEDEPSASSFSNVEAAAAPAPNPFGALTAVVEAPSEAKAAASEFYEQPSVGVGAQAPAVTSWQPPAPSDKKKGSRFGGFFRQ